MEGTTRIARIGVLLFGCCGATTVRAQSLDSPVAHALAFADQQLVRTVAEVGDPHRFPRSTLATGEWSTKDSRDWTSGFFPGCLWFMDERSADPAWTAWAAAWTAEMEREKNDTSSHDVGFKILCSFGNGLRLSGDPAYQEVILQGARSLATRYNPVVGCTRSWNNWTFPVIVDNMMNLEILFWASRHGGDPAWYAMALGHALRTRTDHVRADGSTYHLVDYDPNTGAILAKKTVQGYADESTWARGQAWALYGFTMTYRETRDPRFLATAAAVADWFVTHLPADQVPCWDFEAPNVPDEEKDSSAAAIAASGLLELSALAPDADTRTRYRTAACDILASLCSPAYLAEGRTSRGLLLHGVGHHPASSEVDVSLIYGDYYFLEALQRYQGIASGAPSFTGGVRLLPVGPNPCRAETRFDFTLAAATHVVLRVFDVRGAEVRVVLDDGLPAGLHHVTWDGTRSDGTPVASGTYFCALRAGDSSQVSKLSWVR